MSQRWITFFVWAAVAASALAWGLKLMVAAPQAPPQTGVADSGAFARGDLSRLLGADAVAAVADATPVATTDARFNLLGVVSPRPPRAAAEGLALIAVDGKRAKAFRVGAVVDGDNVLQTVELRGATLGPQGGPSLIALSIPPPAPAATGVLPPPMPLTAPPQALRPTVRTLPPVRMVDPLVQNQPRAGRAADTTQ